ncbi:DUF871 domain-containing protein [Pectinatus frisingensis]|uniref:DUF871 domain-containing protein n=1 Tax=Pectinatus frisingensis TaxID=865 RepID=UPI0018C7A47D|nr:MupG family TIM beta-alpha barrel fold protein [Pectinatus frisingensis]
MNNGISLYPGLENSFEENLQLINIAADCHIKRIFTSFHIPETNFANFRSQFDQLMKAASQNNMEIIADISPDTLTLLGSKKFNASLFKLKGIKRLRIDYGYENAVISELSHNSCDIKLQLNASTVTRRILNELALYNADFSHIDALHNFYPHPGTGISEKLLADKTQMLQENGIKVGAFIPSHNRPRPPLKKGLPTLEEHRRLPFDLAARHLCALGVNSIFIGDSFPTIDEIQTLAHLQENIVTIKARLYNKNPAVGQLLQHNTFTARLDEARDVIRTQESRQLFNDLSITQANSIDRQIGMITLDNDLYGRYKGELQIIKNPQPADEKTNVVGQIPANEIFLLRYITPGRKFRLDFS